MHQHEPSVGGTVIYASISHPVTKSIHEIKLDLNRSFTQGTNLTMKPYRYAGQFQAESKVWTVITSTSIELHVQVLHLERIILMDELKCSSF